jgi:hypothetical protein
VIGQVGPTLVARRLIHVRRAWPVESAQVEFDYGPTRGTVAGQRGGWVYRSDDDDYGFINVTAKTEAHVVAGRAEEVFGANWPRRLRLAHGILAWLTPLLTVLALVAFAAALSDRPVAAQRLLAAEAVLLASGLALVWYIRRRRWVLRAAVTSGVSVAARLQCAVDLLGQRPSPTFPMMALWRAAQDGATLPVSYSADTIRRVKNEIAAVADALGHQLHQHHRTETRALALSWGAAALVILCLVAAIVTHSTVLEMMAIWLPSVVAAAHAWVTTRQLGPRMIAGREFLSELTFVQRQLTALAPQDSVSPGDRAAAQALGAAARLLCRCAGVYTQRQLLFAIAEEPGVPV